VKRVNVNVDKVRADPNKTRKVCKCSGKHLGLNVGPLIPECGVHRLRPKFPQ